MNEGADLNLADNLGATPLIRAAGCGHLEVASILLSDNRLEIDLQDRYGSTALHYACEEGRMEMIKALLDRGADRNIKNKEEKVPLEMAKPEIQKIIVNLLSQG